VVHGWPRGLERQLCYGGDYNPEQWPDDTLAEDVELMRRAGVNLVSVGVFSWSLLEPREGEYEFGWLDGVLDRLHAAGIFVALATPTASPPPWFSFAHPETLPVDASGVRLTHGSRDTYCASAPAYGAAALGVATALARRYAGHPALALWHVHNEYATDCHCDHVATAFRRWLRDRYGCLDRLNEAWTTTFWSQVYGDWSHVLPPRATRYLGNPAQLVDFRRFLSDELLACFREQRDALREITPDVPITTNFVFGGWVPVDQWSWAREVDVVALDHYPSADATAEAETAFAADLARGWAGGRPWLLIEQAPNLIYDGGRMLAKEPGRMTRLSLSHVARGSRGAMFFQWRAPRGGAEMFHSAMVPHAGPRSRIFTEVVALGELLQRMPPLDDPVTAEVALVWDPQSWWALQGPSLPSTDLDYLAQVQAAHGALRRLGITADVVSPESALSGYRVVVAPALFLLSEVAAASLQEYVRGGGSLVVGYFSGVVDADHRIWPQGYPGPLGEVLGLRVEELHPLEPSAVVTLEPGGEARTWTELVRLEGASAQVRYGSGPLSGEPAVTRHDCGLGQAWYVSTVLDDASLDALLRQVCDAARVERVLPGTGGGIEAVRRADGTLFVINHTTDPVTVAAEGVDAVTGKRVDGELHLAPGAYAVVSPADGRGPESEATFDGGPAPRTGPK
jgi:beta-galactosidase